jgi:dCMP deaminase
MLLGITGFYAAGKDTLAEFLEKKGFVRRSLSDELRKELVVLNIPVTRDNLIKVGTTLREKEGNAVLAKRVLVGINGQGNYTFSSVRNPVEVEELKKRKDFYLLFVDADIHLRYERAIKRNRESEPATFDLFKATEEREYANPNAAGQQLLKVKEMADFVVLNNGSFEDFYEKIDAFLDKLQYVHRRPSWDEYFMELTRTIAKRATCDRGRSGCVIAEEKHIATTGYVGSPPGMPHCDEVGHQMKKVVHEDGKESWHCVRTLHAEQNAILQAARNGISLKGTTLYCKMTPCRVCAMLIIGVGISRVVCEKRYHAGEESEQMFANAGVKLDILNPDIEKYKGQ